MPKKPRKVTRRSPPDRDLFLERAVAAQTGAGTIELDRVVEVLQTSKWKRDPGWRPLQLEAAVAFARASLEQAVGDGLANQGIEDPTRARERRDRVKNVARATEKTKKALQALVDQPGFTRGLLAELAASEASRDPIAEGKRRFDEATAAVTEALQVTSLISEQAAARARRLTGKITKPGEAFWSGFLLRIAITYYQLSGRRLPKAVGQEDHPLPFVAFADAAIAVICPGEPSCIGLIPPVAREFNQMLEVGAVSLLDDPEDEHAL